MNEFYNHPHGRPEPHPHGRPEPHPEYRPTPPFYDHPDPGYCIPPIPPCKPYVPGFSPEEQMGLLTGKVNEMIDLFNRSQMDMWGAYHTIVESALTNDAYYNEITVEEGYIAEAGAPYKVVHIPFLDRAKQPIYLELGLAYNNTTNANVHEDVFSASERVLADKLIPAYQSTNTWYGAVVWKGAPISNIGENPAPYTVGITENGFIKIYENLMNYTQLKQDNVRNAMLANCVLVQGGAMTPDKFEPDEKGQMLGRVGIGMNYDTKERFMVIVNGSDQSGCTAEMLANIFLKYNCTVAVEVANGMKTVGVDKGALMFTPPTVAGDEVPTIPEVNAFWYITKRRHYKNEYVKDVASLTQKYGQMLWRCETANISVDNIKETVAELSQKLDTEISDREEADAHLQEQITQEVADREEGDNTLNERITQEVQTINERIDTEVETLNNLIQSTKTELQNNIDTLEAKVEQYHTELDNADIASVDILQDGTKDTYRLKRKDGTYVDIPIEVYNYELLLQKLDTLAALEPRLEQEIQARKDGDNALSERIDTLTQDTTEADNELKEQLNAETQARAEADTQLQTNIDAEALARQTADNQESTARQEADNALGQRIDNLQADIGADYVEKAGSTMTGELVLFGDPTQTLGAATKQYVDNITAQAVDAEAQERQKQDDLLEGLINQEAQTREQADTALDTRLSGVESAMTQFDNKVVVVGDTTLVSEGVTAIGDGKIVYWVRVGKDAVVLTAYDADAVTFSGYTTELPAFVTFRYENTGVAFSTGVETIVCPVVGAPTDVNQAVNKGYVDDAIAVFGDFKADGSVTATGDFNMGGHAITNVEAPTNDTDVSTKGYVDTELSDAITEVQNQFEQAQNVYVIKSTDTMQDIRNIADKLKVYIGTDSVIIVLTITESTDGDIQAICMTGDITSANRGMTLGFFTGSPTDLFVSAQTYYRNINISKDGISLKGSGVNNLCRISNVDSPVEDFDAATKKYVDDAIAGGSGDSNVVILQPTDTLQDVVNNKDKVIIFMLEGYMYQLLNPIMGKDDTLYQIAGTYLVDGVGMTAVNVSGLPLTTTLSEAYATYEGFYIVQDAGENNIVNIVARNGSGGQNDAIFRGIRNPENYNDAANKQYVDDAIAGGGQNVVIVQTSTTLAQIASAANGGAVIHVDGVAVDSVTYNGVATVSNDGTNITVICGDLYVRGTGAQTLADATTRRKFSEWG